MTATMPRTRLGPTEHVRFSPAEIGALTDALDEIEEPEARSLRAYLDNYSVGGRLSSNGPVKVPLTHPEIGGVIRLLDSREPRPPDDCAGPNHDDGCENAGWTEFERKALDRAVSTLRGSLPEDLSGRHV